MLRFIILSFLCASSALGQDSRFFASCGVDGVYGKGCVEFYDGTWTNAQMTQICRSVAARGSMIELDRDHKCLRDQYQSLCISQQLFSLAYIYLDHMDRLSCQAVLNGRLYSRPESGW
ncbi:MAG: hypothetical protein FJ146_08135 [Deltaproteobacteria bacterium]|nr:hypothetical protein [Deltaproteobacteria bacterium]